MSCSPAKRTIRELQTFFLIYSPLKALPTFTLLIYHRLKPIYSLTHLYIALHNNNLWKTCKANLIDLTLNGNTVYVRLWSRSKPTWCRWAGSVCGADRALKNRALTRHCLIPLVPTPKLLFFLWFLFFWISILWCPPLKWGLIQEACCASDNCAFRLFS